MYLNIGISVIFLLLLGFAILNGRHIKSGIGETPLMYRSVFVQFILNTLFLFFLVLLVFLIFYNWKLLLVLLFIGFLSGVFIFVPIAERILYFSLKPLMKRATEYKKQQDSEGSTISSKSR